MLSLPSAQLILASGVLVSVVAMPSSYASESEDRAALNAAGEAWVDAFNARDADAMVALTTEDVVVLPPNAEPLRGRESVRTIWRRAVASAKANARVSVEETVVSGDYAFRMGEYVYTLPNGVVVERGKFLEVWRHTSDGWRIHRDMFSSNRPLQVPPPGPLPSEPRMDGADAR